jgi:hypothetical protein
MQATSFSISDIENWPSQAKEWTQITVINTVVDDYASFHNSRWWTAFWVVVILVCIGLFIHCVWCAFGTYCSILVTLTKLLVWSLKVAFCCCIWKRCWKKRKRLTKPIPHEYKEIPPADTSVEISSKRKKLCETVDDDQTRTL